jgi:hypothetical protein
MVLVVIFSMLSGCLIPGVEHPNLGRGIVAENRTNIALRFEVISGREHIPLGTIGPGERGSIISGSGLGPSSRVARDDCAVGDIIALDPGGREVARKAPPFCVGDVWVIEAGATESGSRIVRAQLI